MKNTFYLLIFALSLGIASCGGETNKEENKSSDDKKSEGDTVATEETKIGEKASFLMNHIGKHKLETISGFMGANSMIDIYKEGGDWKFTGSSNEGGMREGFENDLTDEQLNKLNTLYFEVTDDLSVVLYCNNRVVFEIPFDEKKMILQLDETREYDKYDVLPDGINRENTFINDTYYLMARDNFDENYLAQIDAAELVTPDFACVSINKNGEINLMLRLGDCCDTYNYTFKK